MTQSSEKNTDLWKENCPAGPGEGLKGFDPPLPYMLVQTSGDLVGIEIFWLNAMCLLISNEIILCPTWREFGDTISQYFLVGVVTLHIAIIRAPMHPSRLWRESPFVRIEIGNQSRFDFG